MKYFLSLACICAVTLTSGQSRQETKDAIQAPHYVKRYISDSGRRYTEDQIDSLEKDGHFVGITGSYELGDSSVYSIFYYDKSRFRQQGVYCGNLKRLSLKEIKKLFPHRSPITDHRLPITDYRSPITDH